MNRKSRIYIAAGGAGIVICIAALLFQGAMLRRDMMRGPSIGPFQAVITALEAYRRHEGSYPESLEELRPKYLASLPRPGWGTNDWRYSRELTSGTFELGVRLQRNHYRGYYYRSFWRDWYIDN